MKLLALVVPAIFCANSDRLSAVSQSKEASSEFLDRQKRFIRELFVKNGPAYRQYCREDLKELILYACPTKRRAGFDMFNLDPFRCNIYEEAHEKRSYSLGAGERGEEFDEEASSYNCESIHEECCGEGCVMGEIGAEECF